MNSIILCRQNINGLDAISGNTVPALLEMCGNTFLERLVDKLIACGIEATYVLSENYDRRISRVIEHFSHKDRIKLEYFSGQDNFEFDTESDYLVCDAVACADLDIKDYIEQNADKENPETICNKNGSFVMSIAHKSNIKEFDFTDESTAFARISEYIGNDTSVVRTTDGIKDINTFLNHQAVTLDKDGGIIKRTDSNFNGVTFIPPVYIGKNVSIGSGAVIGSHTVISDNARIGEGTAVYRSYIGQNAVIGKNCVIEGAYMCPNSTLMNRVRLSQSVVVKDSVCVRSNTIVSENAVIDAKDSRSFVRGEKSLTFDDDGLCSLFDGTTDVSEYVRLGKAIGSSLNIGESAVVGISGDSKMVVLSSAVCCGLCSAGIDAYDLGECILPQLSYAVTNTDSAVGIFIGVDANGDVRLVQKSGLPLITRFEQDICDSFNQRSFRCVGLSDGGKVIDSASEKASYKRFLSSVLPKSLKRICANVRANNTVAARLADELFQDSNDCRGERIVFQLSSDLTSVNAYSEETGNVRWEQLCLLGCRTLFDENKPVSIPYSIPFAADKLAERYQGTLYRYNTICVDETDAAAREAACQPKGSFVRDALLLTVLICRYLNDRQITLKQALDETEPICCTQRYIFADSKAALSLENAQAVGAEGYEVRDKNTTAFIRPCKNSQSLMIFAESTNVEFASAFCDELVEKLRKYADDSKSE